MARILERDKAENFASLFEGAAAAGFEVLGFSSVEVTGLAISVFETVFALS
ncbi:hypothetical protein [Flavobacterium sp. HJJ]|uniref:hypothetical protein n=1 Tax=Flavobacterium sp. HJJ TaxID=2783792 RepID=UPI00188D17AA|nr:hypothetical protein [Flavobacterium sp. HJJ]MBF4472020.1 hypothetical protein [Flavobacterium sp. HJJ]